MCLYIYIKPSTHQTKWSVGNRYYSYVKIQRF